MKGAASVGKVVYVTATLPYLLIGILLVYGLTLDGAIDGIKFFLYPDFEKLTNISVWIEAAVQVLYQFGPAWGGIITMASCNKFHNKVYQYFGIFISLSIFYFFLFSYFFPARDSLLLIGLDLVTSVYGGLAIFSILGALAHSRGIPVSEMQSVSLWLLYFFTSINFKLLQSGPGLAYVAYPAALANIPFGNGLSIIFFLTLLFVNVDSQFGMFETLTSGLTDLFPSLRRFNVSFSAMMATICFLLGLPLCTNAGMYIFQICDWYLAILTFSMVGMLEIIIVAFIYGMDRFCNDAALMFGSRPNKIIQWVWLTIAPVTMLVNFS